MRIDVNGRFLGARPTGVQRVARELVGRLPARPGVRVVLRLPRGASADGLDGPCDVAAGLLPGAAWEVLELPLRRSRAWRDSGGVALDPANAGPPGGRGPRVLLLHDVLPLTHPAFYAPAFRVWFRGVVARAARRATRVVTFTDWARDRAIEALGLSPRRVVVAPQGVAPFDGPPDAGTVARALARLELEPGYALALGSGDPRKNEAFLLDVFRTWRGRSVHVPPLVLVGRGYAHVHRSARGATDPGACPGVRRTGFVDDATLRALYAGASVFCFPSLAEGFGRPPLEAMACGTPAVVADYGAAHEVLGEAATIVRLDVDAWVEALGAIVDESGEARRTRVEAGRARADAYDWDRSVDALLGACREALEEGEAGGRPVPAGVA